MKTCSDRERFESGLARLHAGVAAWRQAPSPVLDLEWSNFLLAYQGENDVTLQRGYSRFLAALLEAAVPGLRQPVEASRDEHGRIRVGFVSSEFRISTVGQYFLRWITDLPRDRFHVSTFHTGAVTDDLTRQFERGSDSFAQVTGNADVVARPSEAPASTSPCYPMWACPRKACCSPICASHAFSARRGGIR